MKAEKDILERLSREMPAFSKRQKNIALFICDNCDKAAFMTAEMLSEAAGVSESTVVRFAVELGYEGYPGLRKALQAVLRERLDSSQRPRSSERVSISSDIFINTLSSDADSLRKGVSELNLMNFERLVSLASGAPEIYIIGFDGLGPLAGYMERCLSLIRKNVRCLSDDVLYYLSDIPEKTLLIILGGDRGSAPRISIGRFAADKRADVALLYRGELSPALNFADCVMQSETAAGIMSYIEALSRALWASENRKISDKLLQIEALRREYIEDGK